jgi:hypothetical protein
VAIVPKYISWAFLHTNLFALRSIFNALFLINDHHVIFHADGLCRADLDAHFTGNTPNLAYSLHLFPGILGAARDPNPGISRDQFNNLLRAGAHTGTAAHTGQRIHHREVIHHGDGIEGASIRTLAKAYTGVSTAHWAPKSQIRPRAGTMSHIIVFFLDLPLYSRAPNSSDQIGYGRHFFARYLGHLLSHFRFTGKTETGRDIGFIHHRFSVSFASSVATTPSLGASQYLLDFLYLGVDLYCKFVGSQGKAYSEEQAYGTEHGETPNGQFNQKRIHVQLVSNWLK